MVDFSGTGEAVEIVDQFNAVEAVFWIVLGVLTALFAGGRLPGFTGILRIWLVCTLIAFGISDLCELRTGAWWRPWWLLVWKGACLLSFAAIAFQVQKNRKITPS